MDSGIWDFTADDELVGRFDADPMFEWTPEQTVELIKAQPADFAPGEKVAYCDSNYVLLGLILEQVTGHDRGRGHQHDGRRPPRPDPHRLPRPPTSPACPTRRPPGT